MASATSYLFLPGSRIGSVSFPGISRPGFSSTGQRAARALNYAQNRSPTKPPISRSKRNGCAYAFRELHHDTPIRKIARSTHEDAHGAGKRIGAVMKIPALTWRTRKIGVPFTQLKRTLKVDRLRPAPWLIPSARYPQASTIYRRMALRGRRNGRSETTPCRASS